MWGPLDRSASVLEMLSEEPFSHEQCLRPMLLMTTQKIATYGDCLQEAYKSHTWTGTGSIHVVCIRFPLYGVH
jgi:hypothetical protein